MRTPRSNDVTGAQPSKQLRLLGLANFQGVTSRSLYLSFMHSQISYTWDESFLYVMPICAYIYIYIYAECLESPAANEFI